MRAKDFESALGGTHLHLDNWSHLGRGAGQNRLGGSASPSRFANKEVES
jgi:hypothetical protein